MTELTRYLSLYFSSTKLKSQFNQLKRFIFATFIKKNAIFKLEWKVQGKTKLIKFQIHWYNNFQLKRNRSTICKFSNKRYITTDWIFLFIKNVNWKTCFYRTKEYKRSSLRVSTSLISSPFDPALNYPLIIKTFHSTSSLYFLISLLYFLPTPLLFSNVFIRFHLIKCCKRRRLHFKRPSPPHRNGRLLQD